MLGSVAILVLIFIAGLIIWNRENRRKDLSYCDSDVEIMNVMKDAEDVLIDPLYEHDNDINHLVEQEAERIALDKRNGRNQNMNIVQHHWQN